MYGELKYHLSLYIKSILNFSTLVYFNSLKLNFINMYIKYHFSYELFKYHLPLCIKSSCVLKFCDIFNNVILEGGKNTVYSH